MKSQDYAPTDMMYRRTPLPLRGRFWLRGTTVTITTNQKSVLLAAEAADFVPVTDTNQLSNMSWEIVGMPAGPLNSDWECNVTLGNHSLFLSMGLEQWFAFDLETYGGAGFVVIGDSNSGRDTNAELYLLAIAHNIGTSLLNKLENGRYD
jgi:hypothetical protein